MATSMRGNDVKKRRRPEKDKVYRRGGIWYDPMCFPEFEGPADRLKHKP